MFILLLEKIQGLLKKCSPCIKITFVAFKKVHKHVKKYLYIFRKFNECSNMCLVMYIAYSRNVSVCSLQYMQHVFGKMFNIYLEFF